MILNLDEHSGGYTSKQMFASTKSEIEFVQVTGPNPVDSCISGSGR